MCGICGIIPRKHEASTLSAKSLSFTQAMIARLRYRGPDDEGTCVLPFLPGGSFGHSRLSIIDLSPQGQQPMYSEDRSHILVTNGEIYNFTELRQELLSKGHKFRSSSDSEVILHLYEEEGTFAFDRLRGMYAVALYDQKSRKIILARDPLGIKPLYVYKTADFIAFASEINAFRALPETLQVDIEGISSFLLLGCIAAPRTHFKNVRALRSGEIVTIQDGNISYQGGIPLGQLYENANNQKPGNPDTVRESLRDSIQRHLISDAPIGLFLSGGIDSGIIAGLARETTQADVRTVCVTVPGHTMDESRYARMTAERYGISLQEVPFSQSDFESSIDAFFNHIDMPTIDGFNTFIVSQAARQAGLTVALSGVGGDELFGGYPTFSWVPFFNRISRIAGLLGAPSRRISAQLLRLCSQSSGGMRVSELLGRYPADRRIAHLAFRGLFVGDILSSLLNADSKASAETAFSRYMSNSAWAINRNIATPLAVAGMEIEQYMQPMLLRDTDVFSMAHSLEVRTPLVDMDVFQTCLPFLCNPPAEDKHPKWLLRHSVTKPLPSPVVTRKKQGFSFPWQEWMQGYTLSHLDEMLNAHNPDFEFLNISALRRQRDLYVSGKAHWRCLWGLYVLMRMLSDS